MSSYLLRSVLTLLAFSFTLDLGRAEEVKKPWTEYARRLFGESKPVQQESEQQLRSLKDLDKVLTSALDKENEKDLALDVISSLRLYSFMGKLVEVSRYDKSGVVYQAMTSLTTPKNRPQLIKLFKVRLENGPMSFPARIVIIDSLGRYGTKLPIDRLKEWLEKGNFELQSSVLNYLRRTKTLFKNDEFKQLSKLGLQSPFFQLRLLTLYNFPYYLLDLKMCKEDPHIEVRSLCNTKSTNKEVDW